MSNTDGIEWADPPLSRAGKDLAKGNDLVVEGLKASPGRWARVKTGMASASSAAPWRRRGLQTRSVKADDGTFDVYARWPES